MFPALWLSCLYIRFYFALLHSLSHQTTTVDTNKRIETDLTLPERMYPTTFVIAIGFTLAVLSSAAPVSERAPARRSLFTPVCCQENASNNTGVANVTVGGFPDHKHNPDCEHEYNTTKGHATEGNDHATKTMGNSSPYQRFNASAYVHPTQFRHTTTQAITAATPLTTTPPPLTLLMIIRSTLSCSMQVQIRRTPTRGLIALIHHTIMAAPPLGIAMTRSR